MSSINDLINKSKGSKDETVKNTSTTINKLKIRNTPDIPITASKLNKPKFNLGIKKPEPVLADEKPKTPVFAIKRSTSPISELANVLSTVSDAPQDSISSILGDLSNEIASTPETPNAEAAQNQNEIPHAIQSDKLRSPTLDDLSKFVFEEQPDSSTEEIAFKFSNMLDGLSGAMGTDIPTVLAETLLFMKEHAFLATLLKPEEIGKLVQTMARSYGYVAGNQSAKSVKRKAKAVEQNAILNSLDNLSF